MTCSRCGRAFQEDDLCCGACGSVGDLAPTRCDAHGEAAAEWRCLICGVAMCETCATIVSRRSFCAEHAGYRSVEGWIVVYTTNTEWDAQLLSAYLREQGIRSVIDSKKDSMRGFTVGLMSEMNVAVPPGSVLEAERHLEAWRQAT